MRLGSAAASSRSLRIFWRARSTSSWVTPDLRDLLDDREHDVADLFQGRQVLGVDLGDDLDRARDRGMRTA